MNKREISNFSISKEQDIAYKEFRSRMIQYAYTEWCQKLEHLYTQGEFSPDRFANLLMVIFKKEFGIEMTRDWPQVCYDIEETLKVIKEKNTLIRDFQNL